MYSLSRQPKCSSIQVGRVNLGAQRPVDPTFTRSVQRCGVTLNGCAGVHRRWPARTQSKHSRVAGGIVGEGGVRSSETSAYPTDFNHYLARAILSLARPTPARTVTNHDVREHAPDGGTTMDPAFVPPLLPPPPRAAAEAPAHPCPNRCSMGAKLKGRRSPDHLRRRRALEARRRRPRLEPERRPRRYPNYHSREAPAPR